MSAIKSTQTIGKTLRVLAALLGYPDSQLRGDLPEMRELLRGESALSASRLGELDALMQRLQSADPLDSEADYVDLFDRGRATSLHLFEHVHGDSRERGPAMIDLGQTYANAGLLLAEGELPDYLPAVLEFVSTQPPAEAMAFLGEMAHIVKSIFAALARRDSAYASALAALLDLAGESIDEQIDAQALPGKAAAEESLDASWVEPEVFAGCSAQGQARPGQAQPIHIIRAASAAQGASS